MSTGYINLPASGGGITTYPTAADFPTSAVGGSAAIAVDTDTLYIFNTSSVAWIPVATPGAAIAIDALIGDATATGPGSVPLTLATVNASPGTFGDASHVASIDVNGKGLTTAASSISIQIAESQVTNLVSDLAGKQATLTPGSISTSTTGVAVGNGSASTVGPNVTVDVQTASASQPGLLSAADFSTFNAKQNALTFGDLADMSLDGITITGGTGAVIGSGTSISQHVADATHNGYLNANDWNIFNNKLDASRFNDITGGNNGTFEVDTIGFNLYDNTGRTAPATLVNQDLTYTSSVLGGGGNGVEIEYIYNASFPSSTPNINVISASHVQVQWNNGPTVANNPTATQLKAAWDAVPAALAVATIAISGTAGNRQYIVGAEFLSGGGDTSPTTGTGGSPAGITFTRNTATPLVGIASGQLSKDAASREGQGVSTDFFLDAADQGNVNQINFVYEGSASMTLGSNSDVQIFLYDITNAALIPVTPVRTIAGPVSTAKTFTGVFTAAINSISYRLIFHIATSNASAWDLLIDSVVVNNQITPGIATQVPSVVLLNQPISGAVTDHMCVMWLDGATQWVPATSVYGSDYWSLLGFATNIVGSTASIYTSGYMDGFSFGPFAGYNQYVDPANAGGLTPSPSPFNDTYLIVGKAISATALDIQFFKGVDLIVSAINTPVKGGLLSNSGVNDGTGDQVLLVGGNGNVLTANSAASLGINWAPAVVAAAPFTYTTATRTLTAATATNSVAGFLSAADHTSFAAKQSATLTSAHILVGNGSNVATDVAMSGDVAINNAGVTSISAATVTGKALTGFVSGAGTITATDTILTGFNKINGNDLLKAPIAGPTFTGDVNSSTGNVLVSTIGKGLSVKTGTNAKIGTAVLVGGSATVSNTSITANSRIFLTSNVDGGTVGFLRVSAKTASTSFVITSSSGSDTSTVAWLIVESIP